MPCHKLKFIYINSKTDYRYSISIGIADEALFGFIMLVNLLTGGGAILPDGVDDAFDTFNVILNSSDLVIEIGRASCRERV